MSVQPQNLRPLKVGEILDRAFWLYRANFWLFIGIAGVLLGPLLVLKLLSQSIFQDTTLISLIEFFLTICLLHSAMIWAASRAYLGLPGLLNESYQQALHYFKPIFLAYFRQSLVYLPPIILFIVSLFVLSREAYMYTLLTVVLVLSAPIWGLYMLSGEQHTEALTLICLILFALPYVFFFLTRWSLASTAIILENLDGARGLGQSWSLTSKGFWRTFVVLAAASLLSYLVISLPNLIITYTSILLPILFLPISVTWMVFTQLGLVLSLPLSVSILVILYYDLRIRYAGYDLELALKAIEQVVVSNE